MNFLLVGLGVILNSIGFCFFADGVIHRAMAGGAVAAGLFSGLIGLIFINVGILLMVMAFRGPGRL